MNLRAAQDIDIYKAILRGEKLVYLPSMDEQSKTFWVKLANKLGYTCSFEINAQMLGTLQNYTYTKDILQWKSKGLESEVIARVYPFVDTLSFKETQETWTDPIEPLLCFLGAGYGYKNIIIGSERVYGNNWLDEWGKETFFYPCTMEFVEDWRFYSECNLMLPLILMDKLAILKVGLEMGIKFYSCKENSYCGRCAKCTEVYLLYKILKKPAPFEIKELVSSPLIQQLLKTHKVAWEI
jgi:hypothetical protein